MSLRITPLTDPNRGLSSHRLAWLACDSGEIPVGSAFLRLFTNAGQEHLAELQLHVHPVERRNGIGSRLLRETVTAARDNSRRCILAQTESDSPGAHFLAANGFRKVLTLTYARLALAEVDITAFDEIVGRPRPGYRLASWSGTVPDDLAETFAASRRAMDDMPMDDTDYGTVTWDVDRVRAAVRAIEQRGELLHTVVAVDASDGSVAGFTELVVPGDGTGEAQHYGTGVLPEHRGRGLGRWMKAESVRQARRRHPELVGLLTDTADNNHAMKNINDSLGYRPTHTALEYQLDL